MRILVVEDEKRIADDIAAALRASGYVVDLAGDGDDAWFRGGTETYDAAILDVHLPDGSGLDVLERMRDEGAAIPVVVITADDSQPVRLRAERLGVTAFLTKPVQPLELLRILEQVLRQAP